MFLSYRPFVVITTLSTGLVGIEVTSTPTRPVDNVVITTKGLQDRNINILDRTTVENKGKLPPVSLNHAVNISRFLKLTFFS